MPQPDKLEMCIPLKIVLLPFLLSWWGSWAWLTIARRIQKHDSINKHLHEMLLQAWFSKGWTEKTPEQHLSCLSKDGFENWDEVSLTFSEENLESGRRRLERGLTYFWSIVYLDIRIQFINRWKKFHWAIIFCPFAKESSASFSYAATIQLMKNLKGH